MLRWCPLSCFVQSVSKLSTIEWCGSSIRAGDGGMLLRLTPVGRKKRLCGPRGKSCTPTSFSLIVMVVAVYMRLSRLRRSSRLIISKPWPSGLLWRRFEALFISVCLPDSLTLPFGSVTVITSPFLRSGRITLLVNKSVFRCHIARNMQHGPPRRPSRGLKR